MPTHSPETNPVPRHEPATPSFLNGGGEMGALMRAHDWAASSLGPPAQWPQTLRTVVRLMLNSGHPMYIWWGPELACLYNDAYCVSIGPERHPGSLGRPALEVWAEIWDVIGPQIEQVMDGRGATWHVNQRVPITRHGRREDVYWTYGYSPIDDESAAKGVGGVLVVCTETTQQVIAARAVASERDQLTQMVEQRLRTEAALRESEASFRSALRAGRLGSWQTDRVTMTRQWSQEGMDLFGLQLPGGRGQVGGPDDEYVAALHPDDRHLAQRFHQLADAQDSFPAEYRIVRPDGSTLWLSGRGLVVQRGPDGRMQRLVSIMADATERKQAEEVLRVERERLTLALTAGQMGAYELDFGSDVLWWSLQTYELFGVDPATFVPTRESVPALIHPEERDEFLRQRAEAIAQHRLFTHEFRVLRGDGQVRWLSHRGQAEYDEHGQPLRNFGIVMDVTERRQVEQLLRDADRKKDNFIATLAHELRNPLAPIRHAIQRLAQAAPDNPHAAWCVGVVNRQVAQMARLLDDLLDVSLMTRSHLQLRREALQLADVIRQAVEIAQPLIEAGQHALVVDLPPGPLPLDGDLTRLAQVFSNVLINAAKYTPARGRIVLRGQREGDTAIVSVSDTGIGIAAKHIAQIFEPFGQVESALSRSQGGQGIGLALAKGLLDLHGGSIGVRSEGPGKGSVFEIRLPLAAPSTAGTRAHAGAQPPAVARKGRHILIADDLRDITDTLAILLSDMGHVVDVAYDGEQALQLAEQRRPEVVLLDLGMPRLNGYEVCRRIRAAPWGARMTLIAQTGWGQAEDRRRTREAGFDHHVVKPVDFEDLAALLES